jgi:DNA-directed RNA polymerase subunit RPC12/RpoP
VTPEVEILRCPGCGADVALGQDDHARCAHCGKAVPVPDAHRELRALQRGDAESRVRAQALLATLDSPPWLVTRVLAATFDQPMLVFWLVFGVPVGLGAIIAGLAVDARLHPPAIVTVAVIFGFLFAAAFLPRSFGIYAHRRAGARRVLLAGLAARPPKLPGGPAGCRSCGAPLDVAPGALVARCAYCGVESAVHVRTPLLARLRKAARATASTIEAAAAIDLRERAESRRELRTELRRYLVVTATFGALFATWMWDYQRVTARGDDSAPVFGLVALVVGTLLLIVLLMRSAGTDPRAAEEARARRGDGDLPGWVRVAGPVGFWVALWAIRWAVWR